MKISLFFIIFLFINGVFGDTEEVSVNDGDSVTLHAHITDIQTEDMIFWWFNGSRIARINREISVNPVYDDDERFKDRLKMNPQNGDLTITNITSQHTGKYTLEILREKRKTKRFSVNFSPKVKIKIVGDSFSLHIDVTEKLRKEKIHWKIKHKNSLVAEIMTENERVTINKTFNGFRGELKMNVHTGDLIITNMKKNDSGVYEADVTIGSNTHTIHKTFSFTGSETSKNTEDVESSSSRSSGQIAGICVGVLTLVIAVVGGVIYRRRIRNPAGMPPTTRYSTEMSEIQQDKHGPGSYLL